MRPAGVLRDLVRLSIRKFVVDYSADRASRSLQAGRLVKAGRGRSYQDLTATAGLDTGLRMEEHKR